MKNWLFLIVLLFTTQVMAEDKFVVDKLLLLTSDLSASTKTRLDGNGDACALLKVLSNERLAFEGNIVGDVENKNGEYWVYLTKGTSQIVIKSLGKELEPLKLNFRNYNLQSAESKKTYQLSFLRKDYEKLRSSDYQLISGAPLRKYNVAVFQSPFKSDVERIAQYLKEKGGYIQDPTDSTIIGIKEDGFIVRYAVIIEPCDEEDLAILFSVGRGGEFAPIIYELDK